MAFHVQPKLRALNFVFCTLDFRIDGSVLSLLSDHTWFPDEFWRFNIQSAGNKLRKSME